MKYSPARFHERLCLLTFIILLLVVDPFGLRSLAQQKQASTSQTVDWKALTPEIKAEIEAALAEDGEFKSCYSQERWIENVQTADVTGDGIP